MKHKVLDLDLKGGARIAAAGTAASPDDSVDSVQEKIVTLSKIGYRHIHDNQLIRAQECFSEILAIERDNSYALVGMGDVLRKQRKFKNATYFYQICLRSDPENGFAIFGVAESLQSLGYFREAVDYWLKYLDNNRGSAIVYTRLADAYRKLDMYDEARSYYSCALEAEPVNRYALVGSGWLHFKHREYRQALDHWLTIVEKYSDHDARLYVAVGRCYHRLSNFSTALFYFREAFKKDKDNLYAIYGVIDAYKALDQHDDAIELLLKLIQNDPTNRALLICLGKLFEDQGDIPQAYRYYRDALAHGFDHAAAFGIARLHKLEGKYEEALQSLRNLVGDKRVAHRVMHEIEECQRHIKAHHRALL